MKKWLLPIGIIVIIVIAVAAFLGGNSSSSSKARPSETKKELRFQGRADAQEKDTEILINESADLEGLKLTVTEAKRTTQLSEFETAASGEEYVVVSVNLEDVSDKSASYNTLNFRLQTANEVLDQELIALSKDLKPLNSGNLIPGGKVSGDIVFKIPKESGHQYLIYKPNPFKSDRIIVQVQ